MEEIKYSDAEKAILLTMFSMMRNVIDLNEYFDIEGEIFNANDLYELATKIGIEY